MSEIIKARLNGGFAIENVDLPNVWEGFILVRLFKRSDDILRMVAGQFFIADGSLLRSWGPFLRLRKVPGCLGEPRHATGPGATEAHPPRRAPRPPSVGFTGPPSRTPNALPIRCRLTASSRTGL